MIDEFETTKRVRHLRQFALRTVLMSVTVLAAVLGLWRQTQDHVDRPEAYLGMAITGIVAAIAPLAVTLLSRESKRAPTLTLGLVSCGLAPFAWWLLFAYSLFR